MLNFLRRSYPRTTLYRAFAAAPPTSAAGRNTALLAAIRQVEAAHGRGSIMQLGQSAVTVVDVIPTGSLALDAALGIGGLPRGRIVEVYGAESSGKTTVALQVVSQAQKMGLTCVYVDAEHAIDPSYAKALGINLDALYLSQPDTGEQALEIVDTMVRSGGVDVVVVDSVAALVPKAELEGEMGDSHMALQARLMSQALRKLTASLAKSHCLIIFINQIRSKVGVVFGSPDVTSGGNALKFYASIRLEIRRTGQVKGKGENEIIGNLLRVKVAKNKMAPPFRVADFEMTYGKGVSVSGEIVDLGLACGVFERSGAWFAFKCPDTVASVNAALAKGERVVVESGEEDAGGAGAAAAVEVGGGKAAKGGKAKKSSAAAAVAAAAAAAAAEESTLSSPPPTHRAPPTASAAGVESVEVGQPFAQGRDKAKAWFEARPGAMEVAAAAVKNALKKGGLGKTASAPGAIAAVGLAVSPLPGVASLEEELGPLADV